MINRSLPESSHIPRLRCYPQDDALFLEAAQRALDEVVEHPTEEQRLSNFVTKLISMYPTVTVHPRKPIANDGTGDLWYCYRDGSHPASPMAH